MANNNTLSNEFQQSILLTPEHAGKRLDVAINELFDEFSRSQIQKWIKDGSIKVNGSISKTKYTVLGDEEIDINIEMLPTNEWLAENIKLNIIFEDDDIIVIDKPAGMVAHPGAGNMTGTISNALLGMYDSQKNLPRAGIVHRLDKDTTGLMVAAKTSLAYHSLVNQLAQRKVSRKYIAIVDGEIYEDGTVDEPIGRDPNNRIKMAINYKGKEAITNYIPYEIYDGFTIIECQLETGRTHQIRVHMKHIKHPLVGDQTYNKPSLKLEELGIEQFPRQALHAYSLAFLHPKTDEEVSFKSDLPDDMYELSVKLSECITDEEDMDFEYEEFSEHNDFEE